jgi:hypothetical protein
MTVLALSSAVLAGCSDDPGEEPSAAPEPTATATHGSATASETPYLPVPAGVELTPQGATLGLGESATVAYRPRQDVVGVLGVTVERIEKTSFKESFAGWKLGPEFQGTTPYFVRATLTNEGDTDLGGRPVPLRLLVSADRLVDPSQFEGTFKPCPSKPFPKTFAADDTRSVCLVFLAPEGSQLEAVSFRPDEEFNPITWTGTITRPLPDKPEKPKGDKGRGNQRG